MNLLSSLLQPQKEGDFEYTIWKIKFIDIEGSGIPPFPFPVEAVDYVSEDKIYDPKAVKELYEKHHAIDRSLFYSERGMIDLSINLMLGTWDMWGKGQKIAFAKGVARSVLEEMNVLGATIPTKTQLKKIKRRGIEVGKDKKDVWGF